MRALPLAAGINEGGHYFLGIFGPSGVRVLPLAAGINVGGHSSSLSLSSGSLLILPEGVVVGIQIFAWAPNYYK